MTKTTLEAINEKVGQLKQMQANCTERLHALESATGEKFDFTKPIPGIEESMGDIEARVLGLIGLASGFNRENDLTLVPNTFGTDFQDHLTQVTQHYQALKTQLDELNDQGGIETLDPEGFIVQSKDWGRIISLHEIFEQISNAVESALVSYYPLANVLNATGFSDFSAAFHKFSRQLSEVQKTQANLSQVVAAGKKSKNHVEELQKQADVLKDELDRLKTEGEKDRKTIAEYTAESTQKVTSIRIKKEQAEQLETAIQHYQARFDVFQKELEKRNETFKSGKEQQEKLLAELAEIKNATKTLTEQAEGMLTGATVIGLADSFGKSRDKLEQELKGARQVFYLAVFLLSLSVLPLLGYVLSGFSWLSGKEGDVSSIEFFGHIIGRALLLLPAVWFAKFAAARHAVLFRLKEDYAHKCSVASSVDGFKKQAEPFKDAIAAATFFELTFNPTNRMESKGHEERHPNRVMEWVMEKLGTTYDGK